MEPSLHRQTACVKAVSSYAGLAMDSVLELDIYTFTLLLRDAVIENMEQSEEGQKQLREMYLLQQTEPELNTLHGLFGKHENNLEGGVGIDGT